MTSCGAGRRQDGRDGVSPADAVPYLDRVPHGVVELIEGFGARVVSSGALIIALCRALVASELTGHRRAAEAIERSRTKRGLGRE